MLLSRSDEAFNLNSSVALLSITKLTKLDLSVAWLWLAQFEVEENALNA